MANQKRDLLDELIDLRQDWNSLSHVGDNLASQFVDPDEAPVFDPSDYKERPRPSSTYCACVSTKDLSACDRCRQVCPVDAITIEGSTVRIGDSCRECCLCAAVCPTEAFVVRRNAPLALYDKIARAATAYEQCYITCTRALGRLPQENEIVLPCVGALSTELWFNLLCEYPNLSVYLPLGICDRCQTTTGEEALSDAIATAEEWSGESVGLEVSEEDLTYEQKRAYKRSQFVSEVTQAGTRLVSRGVPVLAGAQAVANRVKMHSEQITKLQKSLEQAVGTQNTQRRRRMLTRKRKLLMAGIQKYPDLADEILLAFPQVDVDRCTSCADCTKACTLHALEVDAGGKVHVEPAYCTGCGACVVGCPEGAISLHERTIEDLVVPDERAEERERQRAQSRRLKEQGKKTLEKGLDALERLADDSKE